MNVTNDQRSALELYGQAKPGANVTVTDVARELMMGQNQAGELVTELVNLGLLSGDRLRKITPEGQAVLEGRDLPASTPPPSGDGGSPPVATEPQSEGDRRKMLSEVLAERHHVEPAKLISIISTGIISTGRGESAPTMAEIFHVMSVMESYRLDPWMKQLHAFRHRGKLHVMVGYDGWVKLANRNPGYIGAEYEYASEMVDTEDGKGKRSWEWIKCTVHSKGRIPTAVYCFLDEWYVKQGSSPGPWQLYTRWRHRQKAFTLAVREHFGIGLYDETDMEQIRYHQAQHEVVNDMGGATNANADQMRIDLIGGDPGRETPVDLGSIDPSSLAIDDDTPEESDSE